MLKKRLMVLMSVFALLLSNMAVYAADDDVNMEDALIETEVGESDDYEEEIITLKEVLEEGGEFIEIEDFYSINTLGSVAHTLKAGGVYFSSSVELTAGGTICVGGVGTPTDKSFSVGILQPDGVIRRVTTTGSVTHTFTVTQSGTHKVYIANRSDVTMNIGASYTY
ncbi:MAG: hypothetical protein IJ053_02260 [Lachnospiraceae bacterium]|nr:hypothetical protein [Lachnospiraceae bacterium]